MKLYEGWDIELIKKIKSKLSVKIFIITFLLMTICSSVTYFFLSWSLPQTYEFDFTDINNIVAELSNLLMNEYKENAPIWFEDTESLIESQYKNEFTIHIFQSDGLEIDLENINRTLGKTKSDYDSGDISEQYTTYFLHDTSPYTIFFSRNKEKSSLFTDALRKSLPPLYAIILSTSTIVSFFYTWYITAPIKKISNLSCQMKQLNFNVHCTSKRIDEIGILAYNLNCLSDKLATTLSELQASNEKLKIDITKERELEQRKIEFFSGISHELKTPITIIKGQLQGMLYNVGRYKDHKKYLAQSLKNTEILEDIVQELLTISRLETPEYKCVKKKFNLSKLTNDRINAHEDLFIKKEMDVIRNINPNILYLGDMQLIQKVIDNLISNALLHSPTGNCIFISLEKNESVILFSIENTGVHIPENSLSKLFNTFYRIDQSRNRQTGGSGLGLYIVKSILNLHNAQINITNSNNGVIVNINFYT